MLAPTLEEVRREAEVSVGALYHHFPDKHALGAAVYAQLIGKYQTGFVATLRDSATAEGGIRGGVNYHLRWVTAHRARLRCCWVTGWTVTRCGRPTGNSLPPWGIGIGRITTTACCDRCGLGRVAHRQC